MADPDVVSNPTEYQKLAQSMAELDEVLYYLISLWITYQNDITFWLHIILWTSYCTFFLLSLKLQVVAYYRKFKDCERQIEETKGECLYRAYGCLSKVWKSNQLQFIHVVALAKEDGNDPDMVEMIATEIESLSSQLKELEEKMKVWAHLELYEYFLLSAPI